MSALEQELVTAVGADHVASQGVGAWRVVPGSAAEVAEVIRRAGSHGAAIHPVGVAGRATRQSGGDRPRVYIATRRLDQVLQLDETSLLVHAQEIGRAHV